MIYEFSQMTYTPQIRNYFVPYLKIVAQNSIRRDSNERDLYVRNFLRVQNPMKSRIASNKNLYFHTIITNKKYQINPQYNAVDY